MNNQLKASLKILQFDIEELETYIRAMQGLHAAQWVKAMEEELYQLHKNETWALIPASKINKIRIFYIQKKYRTHIHTK